MDIIEKVRELRKKLHEMPEESMKEYKTKKCLIDYVKENSDLLVIDMGQWFYAEYKGENEKRKIAFRADFDAVTVDGKPRHLCGHDGHSAILSGFSETVSEMKPECSVYLIFQPGEETGLGALLIKDFIKEKGITEIYGFHNIPGFRENEVILRRNTFSLASTGMEISLFGQESHAAYPENGKNPAEIIAKIILYMKELLNVKHKGIVLGTVIGIDLGSSSYGVSAGRGILRLTLRAEDKEEYKDLIKNIISFAENEAALHGLSFKSSLKESFPPTINTPGLTDRIGSIARELFLKTNFPEEPFRWSEDFGYFLEETEGAYFGIGAGDIPDLHTPGYEFNDSISETVMDIYKGLLQFKD